jgi:NADH-quinone oxidoreductase subunit F
MGDGRLEEAYRKHMENNPFPIACARVCPAFCESKCSRGKYDQAIAIREVKRLFADWAIENGMGFAPPLNPKKQRVAIIGAGPAGLSCGFYLTRLGYKPVVFEASNCAGGMMKWGIPDYRLPKDKLAAEIRVIERAGVDIQLNHTVKSLDELKTQGYEAVFIAAGAHVATRLDVPGADKAGVLSGIDFLYRVNGGERLPVGKKVVVIGGGSTAMDTARTAKRLGAEEVRVIYRRTRSEMPALQEELIEAEEEGILLDYLVAPLEVLGNGKVSGIRCQRTALGDFDNSGRRRPKPVEGSEFVLDADLVIPCLGQKMSDKLSHGAVTINKWGFVDADEKSMATNVAGVFAGGDNVNPSTVIECVAQGRRAAQAIDRHFGGEGALDKPHEVVRVAYDEDAYLVNLPRRKPGHNDIAERIRSLSLEVNRGLSLENGIEEARRCLHCDRKQEQEAAVLPKRRLELDEML